MAAEERPAFYALRPGGWRDLVTLLHPPYTAWHLSYVAFGAAAAPQIHADRLLAALAAFFLVATSVLADDKPPIPEKPIAEKKELLFSDDFEGTGSGCALSPGWNKVTAVVPVFFQGAYRAKRLEALFPRGFRERYFVRRQCPLRRACYCGHWFPLYNSSDIHSPVYRSGHPRVNATWELTAGGEMAKDTYSGLDRNWVTNRSKNAT